MIATLAIPPVSATTARNTTQKTTSKATTKAATVKSNGTVSKSKTTRAKTKSRRHKRTATKSWRTKGQQAISSNRARQIQEALIREQYLDGEATGEWDTRTQDAMRRFQADQGWQSKVLPDSRALIKLGLGPDHSDVLNPETAAISPYQPTPSDGGEKSVSDVVVPATTAVRK